MLIDSHCHFEQLTKTEQQAALQDFIVIGVASGLESSKQLLELAKNSSNLKICLGIHPEYPQNFNDYIDVEKAIRQNINHIVGIGEIGLPYFNLKHLPEKEKQLTKAAAMQLFKQFIALAFELNLPVNLHCVEDSAANAITILKQYQIKKALFHWFEGSQNVLTEIVSQGWNISVSPDVMFNQTYQDFIKTVPLDTICLESDGPWLYNGQRGVPAMIVETVRFLAKIHQCSDNEIIQITQKNSHRLWNLNRTDKDSITG